MENKILFKDLIDPELLMGADLPQFVLIIEKGDYEVSITFILYEVVSWIEPNKPEELEIYLNGTIKWDGCSHIYFGDGGYIHMCGKNSWEKHIKIMPLLWAHITSKIKMFDKDTAS